MLLLLEMFFLGLMYNTYYKSVNHYIGNISNDSSYESSDDEVSIGSGYVGDNESVTVTDDESKEIINISALKQNDVLCFETQDAMNYPSSLEGKEDEKLLVMRNSRATNQIVEDVTQEPATASEHTDDRLTGKRIFQVFLCPLYKRTKNSGELTCIGFI